MRSIQLPMCEDSDLFWMQKISMCSLAIQTPNLTQLNFKHPVQHMLAGKLPSSPK